MQKQILPHACALKNFNLCGTSPESQGYHGIPEKRMDEQRNGMNKQTPLFVISLNSDLVLYDFSASLLHGSVLYSDCCMYKIFHEVAYVLVNMNKHELFILFYFWQTCRQG